MIMPALTTPLLVQLPLLTAITAMFVIASGCSTNSNNKSDKPTISNSEQSSDPSVTTDSTIATRPVGEVPEDWTDTPANQTPPNLNSEPSVGDIYCAQDKEFIYGNATDCLFSVESFDNGKTQTLKCENYKVYLNGKVITALKIGNLELKCR